MPHPPKLDPSEPPCRIPVPLSDRRGLPATVTIGILARGDQVLHVPARQSVIKMGMETSHVCRSCLTKFTVQQGGSRKGDVLHCDLCGTRLWLFHEHVQDLRRRYYPKPFLSSRAHTDSQIQPVTPGDSLGPAEYHAAVEDRLGPCACGGRFRHGASPRCPGCLSTEEMWDVDEAGEVVFHD